jgi:hypothetical protein
MPSAPADQQAHAAAAGRVAGPRGGNQSRWGDRPQRHGSNRLADQRPQQRRDLPLNLSHRGQPLSGSSDPMAQDKKLGGESGGDSPQ